MTKTLEFEKLDYEACLRRAADAFARAEASLDPAVKAEYVQMGEMWKELADAMRRNGLTGRALK